MRAMFGVDTTTHYQLGYDFSSLEACIEAHFCYPFERDVNKSYCNSLLQEKPHDVHTMMAKRISDIIGREFTRSPAKSVKYAATYGAQASKIAQTIGESESVGKIVFDAFWNAAEPLKLLKESLNKEWESTGKRFIVGIDGRKVPTRSPHAILNSKFQNGGVICAKRTMVLHDYYIKQAGLGIDFFKDDWKNSIYSQQLIAYHN